MIFVTVGTTPFDSLIKYIDELQLDQEFIFQISDDASYIPKNHKYFKFTKDINKYYLNAELIITHAGAGSTYRLLEMDKKIIIVPNFDRVDNHQSDLTNYMEKEKYAITSTNLNDLKNKIINFKKYDLKKYKKEDFFKSNEIVNIIQKGFN